MEDIKKLKKALKRPFKVEEFAEAAGRSLSWAYNQLRIMKVQDLVKETKVRGVTTYTWKR